MSMQLCNEVSRAPTATVTIRMHIDVPTLGFRLCYLGTQNMSMRYQTPQETITYGNLASMYFNTVTSFNTT